MPTWPLRERSAYGSRRQSASGQSAAGDTVSTPWHPHRGAAGAVGEQGSPNRSGCAHAGIRSGSPLSKRNHVVDGASSWVSAPTSARVASPTHREVQAVSAARSAACDHRMITLAARAPAEHDLHAPTTPAAFPLRRRALQRLAEPPSLRLDAADNLRGSASFDCVERVEDNRKP
eukprot:6231051-Prymnesium_polylepis.1